MTLQTATIQQFQKWVYSFFEKYGKQYPWRLSSDPYQILVSEFMLQQTQTERVIPKFIDFIERFPTVLHLAAAKQNEVLQLWQGLGYNRRALFLHQTAYFIQKKHHGQIPKKQDLLTALPGIGSYTAAAIQAFAFNIPSVVIETNIRTVYIYHFFTQNDIHMQKSNSLKRKIPDEDLLPLIEQTLDIHNPRKWYNSLMDYGAHIKKKHTNPSKRSKQHTVQTPFIGSNRQIRGAIIRQLTQFDTLTYTQLLQAVFQDINRSSRLKGVGTNITHSNLERIEKNLNLLIKEGFIVKKENTIQLKQ